MRSTVSSAHRHDAAHRSRRRISTSALSGHVDYVELAERVGQGVTVMVAEEVILPKSRRRKGPER